MNRTNNSQGLIVGIIIVLIILIGLAYVLENTAMGNYVGLDTNTEENDSDMNGNSADSGVTYTTTNSTTTTTTMGAPTDTAFTIKTADLSPEQKAMLTATGFDGDEIVITNEMKTCAEQSIGSERTQQFANGEKPTVVEAGKLLVCYNQ